MKKPLYSILYITVFSFILINAFIKLFSGFGSDSANAAAFFSVPSYVNEFKIKKADKPDLAAFFVSQCIAAYDGEKKAEPLRSGSAPIKADEKTASDALPDNIKETTITKGKENIFGIEINNETPYDLSYDLSFDMPTVTGEPLILILHTHTSEAYRPTDDYYYVPEDNDRTGDPDFNVSKVGEELARSLNLLGIPTVHDSTVCDYPSYNGSYKKMLEVAEADLIKYPSVKIVIDLHRDAMITGDGTKISTVSEVNGEKAAQIMFVVGTDSNGLYHPDWRSNFAFAVKLKKAADEKFPTLARPLNVRCERFNGHICPGEVLIEVGTNGNTLPEALVSARALSEVIASVIQDG